MDNKEEEATLRGVAGPWQEQKSFVTHLLEGSGGQQLNGSVCIAKGNRELCFNGHGSFTF